MLKKNKEDLLQKIKPKDYQIYGIFDFEKKELVYVNLDAEQVELEFDLTGYDEERYDIVILSVLVI